MRVASHCKDATSLGSSLPNMQKLLDVFASAFGFFLIGYEIVSGYHFHENDEFYQLRSPLLWFFKVKAPLLQILLYNHVCIIIMTVYIIVFYPAVLYGYTTHTVYNVVLRF